MSKGSQTKLLNSGSINEYTGVNNINSVLQWSLTDRNHYELPAYRISNDGSVFLNNYMSKESKSEKKKESIVTTEKFLDDINTLKKTVMYGSQPVIENYGSLGPLQKLNLMSCGDTANYFMKDINGATMGDGTGVPNEPPPGHCDGCPAGNSKFNVFASKFKVL